MGIVFDQCVEQTWLVITVEYGKKNYLTCVKNLMFNEKIIKKKIYLVNAAIWRDMNEIMFSLEEILEVRPLTWIGIIDDKIFS